MMGLLWTRVRPVQREQVTRRAQLMHDANEMGMLWKTSQTGKESMNKTALTDWRR